ncbi:MAG TPA: hypothetical protein VJN02_03180 [Gammaproteobacteria bacterium]|nr:hypothetical protein [Gammaproteobacteria bacterium]
MLKYNPHDPPWRQENRLPSIEELNEISGLIGQTDDSIELEKLAYAAMEAAFCLHKAIKT